MSESTGVATVQLVASHVQSSLTMSPARKVYIIGTWLAKLLIIFLSLMGIFSILKQIGFITSSPGDRQVMEEVEEGSMLVAAVESRRERLYERRREVVREVCEDQEERITLHTVKMYDLVPPAPIGRLAGEQCSMDSASLYNPLTIVLFLSV